MSSPHKSSLAPPAFLVAHPPERGPRQGSVTLPAGCCCCCCCCLHSAGGLAGGIAGSILPIPPVPKALGDDAPFPFRRDEFEDEGGLVPATALYWALVALAILATVGVMAVMESLNRMSTPSAEILLIGLFVALMLLPALQLAASLLSGLIIALCYTQRRQPLQRLGRITLWSFVGSAFGLLVMVLLYFGLVLFSR